MLKKHISIFALGLCLACLQAAFAYDYEFGNPTQYEQLHLEAINRARANPSAEAARLGIDLFEGVPAGKLTSDPKPPLAMNARLLAAARSHSADMLENDFFDHYSLDGTSPFDRMKQQGYYYNSAGENIAFTAGSYRLQMDKTALSLHNILFIDKNYAARGHRTNLLNPEFRETGIGLLEGDYKYQSSLFPWAYMVTCDFGARYSVPPIVTGVVFNDRDGDMFYDAGEGISGVRIYVQETAEYVTTGDAGGYGIPLYPGSYHLKFVHDTLGEALKTVNVSGENVKVDVLARNFTPSPYPVSLELAVNNKIITTGDRLTLDVAPQGTGDLYVFVIVPQGQFFCFTGLNMLTAPNTAAAFPAQGGRALDLTWPYAPETAGRYILGAALVKQGTDPLAAANWLTSEIVEVEVVF